MKSESYREFKTIWLPLLAIFIPSLATFVGALLQRPAAPEKIADEQAQLVLLESAVAQAATEAKAAIDTAKEELSCFQQTEEPNIKLTLTAMKDFYPLNKYKLQDAPKSLDLANHLYRIYVPFTMYKGADFKVSLAITGSADANPLQGSLPYDGLTVICSTASGPRQLSPGPKALNNELLGCARAADFVRYLQEPPNHFDSEIDISGREFTSTQQKAGQFRYISVTLTFHNLANLVTNVSFC